MKTRISIMRWLALLFAMQLLFLGLPAVAADPPGCTGCNMSAGPATGIFVTSSGCTVPFTVRIGNADATACNETNLTVLFACPGSTASTFGPTNVLRTGLNIPAGTTPFTLTDTNGNVIVVPCTITTAPGVTIVQAIAFATNNPGGCQRGANDTANALGTTSLTVTHPCVQITKQCLTAVNIGNSVVITYSGTVTNCGDTPLQNITVVNNQPAPNTPVLQVAALAPGGVTNFTRSYTNTTGNICGPFADTLTVTASDAQNQVTNCPSSNVSSSAPATCNIVYTPCINVTKICSTNLVFLSSTNPATINFSGVVSNCGNITLTNVSLADDLINGGAVFRTIPSLAPGASVPWSTNLTITTALCNRSNIVNTITARGTNVCNLAQGVVDDANCAFSVLCPPDIEVVKEVACYLAGDNCGPFGKVATGVRNSACPAFCYRITVTNAGTVPIVTLTVNDPVLGGDLSSLFGPLPIAPGATRTAIIKPIVHCVDTPDTVTAEGRSAGGQADVDQDSAEARVLNINIECQLTLAPATLSASGPVQVSLLLTNTGTAPLRVTSLSGLPALTNCATGAPIVPALPISIGPTGSVTISGCTFVTCPGGTNFTVTANAVADDQSGTLCVNNQNGTNITDSTSCSASVGCEGCCVFLLIDEDGIDNTTPGYSLPPNTGRKEDFEARGRTFTASDVNDDRPRLAQRAPLRFFNNPTNFGRVIVLRSGQISDEGFFAMKEYPNSWNTAGPTTNGLVNFRGQPCEPFPHGVGPGLGTGNDPEVLLDKIPRVTPLRATGLSMLVGQIICALVWDSDISINYDPLNGSLKGEKLGVVAFKLLEVKQAIGFSSSSLPLLTIEIVDPCEAFNCVPSLFVDAPEPRNSSDPFDIVPPPPPNARVATPSLAISEDGCEITCQTEAGRSYRVEYTDSLIPPNWKVLTSFVGTGSPVTVTDPNGPAQRFYRLVAQ